MGRPKKQTPTVSIRIDEDALKFARHACNYTNETIVEYISRIVRERAAADAKAGAEKFLKETKDLFKGIATDDDTED